MRDLGDSYIIISQRDGSARLSEVKQPPVPSHGSTIPTHFLHTPCGSKVRSAVSRDTTRDVNRTAPASTSSKFNPTYLSSPVAQDTPALSTQGNTYASLCFIYQPLVVLFEAELAVRTGALTEVTIQVATVTLLANKTLTRAPRYHGDRHLVLVCNNNK